jgi:hypothetical protein
MMNESIPDNRNQKSMKNRGKATMKKYLYCAEQILKKDIKCIYCGERLTTNNAFPLEPTPTLSANGTETMKSESRKASPLSELKPTKLVGVGWAGFTAHAV